MNIIIEKDKLNDLSFPYDSIKEITDKRLSKLYGENVDDEVFDRYNKELEYIIQNDYEQYFILAYLVANKARQNNETFILRGAANSSFIVYLLEISNINSFDFSIPFEFYSGISRIRKPYFELEFSKGYLNKIYNYAIGLLENVIFEDDADIPETMDIDKEILDFNLIENINLDLLKQLEEKSNIKHNIINVNDTRLLKYFSEHIKDFVYFKSEKAKQIIGAMRPKTIEDFTRVLGLIKGTNIWENNLEEIIEKVNVNVNEIPIFREEIYLMLKKNKMNKCTAFNISEFISKGRVKNNKYKLQWNKYIKLLEKYNINKSIILYFDKISYMFPKLHCENYIDLCLWIAYYKMNNKNI